MWERKDYVNIGGKCVLGKGLEATVASVEGEKVRRINPKPEEKWRRKRKVTVYGCVKQQDCIQLWLASPWRIFGSNGMWSDLYFKKTIQQTKWIAGKTRTKVGRPASKSILVIQSVHGGGDDEGVEKGSDSRCRLVTVTWNNFLTNNMGCEKKGD